MSNKQFDVVCMGNCCIDYLGIVERYPEIDTKEEMTQFSIQGGGPAATACVTMSLFDLKTSFIGKISDDHFGEFIRKGFELTGVDLSNIVVEKNKISRFSFICIDAETGKRNIFWTRGSVSPLKIDEIPDISILERTRIVHLDGHEMGCQIQFAKMAKQKGVTVSYDAGSRRTGTEELIKYTDILIASERFALQMEYGPLEQTLKRLHSERPSTVVITLGSEGSIGLEGEQIHHEPAIENIKVIDTTGAGDIYHGAFLYAHTQGWELKKKMRFASVAASLSCRKIGGRGSIPDLKEVMDYL